MIEDFVFSSPLPDVKALFGRCTQLPHFNELSKYRLYIKLNIIKFIFFWN